MKISVLTEKYFWILLLLAIIIGLWQPAPFAIPSFLPKLLLGLMLFFVYLKIEALDILEKIRDFRLMALIAVIYMIIVPLLFFFLTNVFDNEMALGLLLLTAMPAGILTPALTDIMKGNVPFAMSIVLVTQLIAPFSVPFLFWLIGSEGIEINKLLLLRDIALLVFTPMILSQLVKRYFPDYVKKREHLYTTINVFILCAFVYVAISSQRNMLLVEPATLFWKTLILYLVFIILHAIGYFIFYKRSREDRIALSLTSAYMNNGLAIVLATTYFSPAILLMMVLSELPWNTLLAPFRKLINLTKKE